MRNAMMLLAAAAAAISAPALAASDGKNRKVVVQNNSNESIYYIYASPITSDDWEEDLLGSGRTLSAGSSINANIDNGTTECRYDLKVKMASGREHVRRDVNVCAKSRWIIGPSGNYIE